MVGKIFPSSSCLEFSTLAIKGHDILIGICKYILSLLPPLIPNISHFTILSGQTSLTWPINI